MHCSDLERYLEAHLDGRLGRNRSAILQRHMSGCATCRQRVDELRLFEKELHGKFRTMRATATLWDTLETALVSAASVKSPPKPQEGHGDAVFVHPAPVNGLSEAAGRFEPADSREATGVQGAAPAAKGVSMTGRWLGAAAGLLVLGAASVWTYDTLRGTQLLTSFADSEPAAGIGLRTDDGFILRNWLGTELGYPLPQTPLPDGFQLLGGSIVERDIGSAAVIAYDSQGGPVMLHLRQSAAGLSFDELVATYQARGMQALAWQSDMFDYAVFGGPDVKNLGLFQN